MISIGAAGSAEYYARDNYYTEGETGDRREWAGKGATALGLTGPVETRDFEAVLAGRLPNGAAIATPSGQAHRPGIDLVFSAPKSISLLALVGGDQRLIAALEASVRATLGWVEANLVEGRSFDPASGQQSPVATGNLVAALFTHDLSRNRDPQLHVHSVIANATQRPDGAWRALLTDKIYLHQRTIAAVHNADLRQRIEALGYSTVAAERGAYGQFEIDGVPREVIRAFSTRSEEIAEALERAGRSGTAAEREMAALATRAAKDPGMSRSDDRAEWQARAASLGFHPKAIIERSLAHAERGETVWSRLEEGVRGMAARGQALVLAMGLVPRDADPLMFERPGRLDPRSYVAAQAVAAGVRHLAQNQAGFGRLELITASLSFGGLIGVDEVETRLDLLERKGLLVASGDGTMVTTEMALALEREVLALRRQGEGRGTTLVAQDAGATVQAQARELGLRWLSSRQEAAAALILASKDRFIGVQGVAGAGKSTMLGPVAAIATGQERPVMALAVGAAIARKLGDDLAVPASSVAAFLARHRSLLDPHAPAAWRTRSMDQLSGALLIVDEASTLSSRQMLDLQRIALAAEVAKLALVGDTRQFGAVEAGKPFAELQADGLTTAELTDNVRAKSEIMRALAPALDRGDLASAFAILQPVTHEVPRGELAAHAVAIWARMPRVEREQTLLLTSGRAMQADANAQAQDVLRATGEIGKQGRAIAILDRVNLSREQARTMQPYREGRMLELRTAMPRQGLAKGTLGTITAVERDRVTLDIDGRTKTFTPARLARNLKEDAVALYEPLRIELHEGDRIRFTANNHDLGVLNAETGRIVRLHGDELTIAMNDDRELTLRFDDPALRRIDLGYAVNAYAAQGVTTQHGIVMMDSAERMLASSRTLAVALTRIADQPHLVVDSAERLERAVTRHGADKVAALDILRSAGESTEVRHRGFDSERSGLRREDFQFDAKEERVQQLPGLPEKSLDLSL